MAKRPPRWRTGGWHDTTSALLSLLTTGTSSAHANEGVSPVICTRLAHKCPRAGRVLRLGTASGPTTKEVKKRTRSALYASIAISLRVGPRCRAQDRTSTMMVNCMSLARFHLHGGATMPAPLRHGQLGSVVSALAPAGRTFFDSRTWMVQFGLLLCVRIVCGACGRHFSLARSVSIRSCGHSATTPTAPAVPRRYRRTLGALTSVACGA